MYIISCIYLRIAIAYKHVSDQKLRINGTVWAHCVIRQALVTLGLTAIHHALTRRGLLAMSKTNK